MAKPILIVETGGTISEIKGRGGVLRPSGRSVITPDVRRKFPHLELLVESIAPHRDSTNLLHEQHAEMAEIIARHASDVDGVVVTIGTDTMAVAAASLTFALQGLGIPVMLTGSILPIDHTRTDAPFNIDSAIISATQDYGEVGIAFWDAVYRGPCAVKINSSAFKAFASPRVAPIGNINSRRAARPAEGRIPRFEQNLNLFTDFNTNVLTFNPADGSSVDVFLSMVNSPAVQGLVMIGYGPGNIPEIYYDGIEQAAELGKPVVIAAACLEGTMHVGKYEVGATPLERGAISGLDMTPTTTTQKLMYALGMADKAKAEGKLLAAGVISYVKEIMHTNIAREITMEI